MSIHSLTAEQWFKAGHSRRLLWVFLGAAVIHLALLFVLPHPQFQPYRLRERVAPQMVEAPAAIVIPPPPKELPKQKIVTEIVPSADASADETMPATVPDLEAPYVAPTPQSRSPFSPVFDTRPVVIRQVKPVYPELARQAELEGDVRLKLGIDELGQVKEALVVESVPGLEEAALEAIYQWEFEPGKQRDVPVPVWIVVPIRFSLRG